MCGITKEKNQFIKDKNTGYCAAYCRECNRIRSAKWRKDNPEKLREGYRRQGLKKSHGITIEEYDSMSEGQDNRCAICHTDIPGGRGRFHVDHNHTTRRIRGLLCSNCNLGIGHLQDSEIILESALAYLKLHKDKIVERKEVA